jgi:hypothetical protein
MRWIWVALLAITACALIAADRRHAVVTGAVLTAAIVAASLWAIQGRITADDAGLCWWTLRRGTRSVPWSDVSDYYTEWRAPDNQGRQMVPAVVRTSSGDLCRFDTSWSASTKLMAWVTEHATSAAAAGRWDLQGTRTGDLPRSFTYDPRWLRRTVAESLQPATAMTVIELIFAGLALRARSVLLLTPLNITCLATFGIGALSLVALQVRAIAKSASPAYRSGWWVGESITASVDGIALRGAGPDLDIPWTEVASCVLPWKGDYPRQAAARTLGLDRFSKSCRIESRFGIAISFSPSISDAAALAGTCRRQAAQATFPPAYAPAEHARNGRSPAWSSGVEGVGDRVFRARTSRNLASATAFWMLPVMVAFLASVEHAMPFRHNPHQSDPRWVVAAVLGAYLAFLAGRQSIDCYLTTLTIGSAGVLWDRYFRRRLFRWQDIARWEFTNGHVTINDRGGRRIVCNTTFFAGGAQIEELLRSRLGPPTPAAPRVARPRRGPRR